MALREKYRKFTIKKETAVVFAISIEVNELHHLRNQTTQRLLQKDGIVSLFQWSQREIFCLQVGCRRSDLIFVVFLITLLTQTTIDRKQEQRELCFFALQVTRNILVTWFWQAYGLNSNLTG